MANDVLKFTEQTFKRVDAGRCPFLQKWFAKKFETISKAPSVASEEGGRYIRRKKQVYALYMVMNPKFSKKHFSEVFEIAYGTARNWVNDKKVTDTTTRFALHFIAAYINEIKKIALSPAGEMKLSEHVQKRDTALDNLIVEAAFYRNEYLIDTLVENILNMISLIKKIDPPTETGKSDMEWYVNRMTAATPQDKINLLGVTGLRFMQIVGSFRGSVSPQLLKSYNELNKFSSAKEFAFVKFLIALGDTKNAVEIIEVLEKKNNQLYESMLFLEIELSKARKKNAKK